MPSPHPPHPTHTPTSTGLSGVRLSKSIDYSCTKRSGRAKGVENRFPYDIDDASTRHTANNFVSNTDRSGFVQNI